MKIMAANSNLPLARAIAAYLEMPLVDAQVRRFADEEIFVEIHENVRGEDVFVVQSTSYPANDNLMELLICIDALKRASARRITAVVPYFGYARQDRKPGPRTPISAKLVANLITEAGANRVLTLELHAGQIQGFFSIPVDELTALPLLARYFQEMELPNPVASSSTGWSTETIWSSSGSSRSMCIPASRSNTYRRLMPEAYYMPPAFGGQNRLSLGAIKARIPINDIPSMELTLAAVWGENTPWPWRRAGPR